MFTIKKSFVLSSMFLPFFLLGCTDKPTEPEVKLTLEQEELYGNWMLLTRAYIHPEEIGDIDLYEGAGDSGDFADVVNMYGDVSDKYTNYTIPKNAKAALNNFLGKDEPMVGFGLFMETLNDTLTLVHVIPGTSAAEKGVLRGDQILSVNEKSVVGADLDSFAVYTKGVAGFKALFSLKRGTEIINVELTKKELSIPNVWLEFVNEIPVIQVDFFAARGDNNVGGTRNEFVNALTNAGDFKTAIIDLRGNPGGSVEECLEMTDDLLASGVIAYEIIRNWTTKNDKVTLDTVSVWDVKAGSSFENRSYVFLADRGSASCSELMLAGIKGNTNWPIVGDTSYGKGIAQNLYTTRAEGLAKITTTQFRDNDMQNYHGVGIAPDYLVEDPDAAMLKALELAQGVSLAKKGTQISLNAENRLVVKSLNERIKNRKARPNGAFKF